MVILIAISTVAVVRPVRERLTAQGNRTNALILVKEADAQLATGDIAGAILSARGAVDNDASSSGETSNDVGIDDDIFADVDNNVVDGVGDARTQ